MHLSPNLFSEESFTPNERLKTIPASSQNEGGPRSSRRSKGIASGAVIDEVDPGLVLYGLVYDLGRAIDHLRIQHAGTHFVERNGLMSQEQT